MSARLRAVIWIVLVCVLAALPTLLGTYYTNLFVNFAIFAVFSVSLNSFVKA